MIKTLILNAPAGVGKDTLADLLLERFYGIKISFKDSLYKEVAIHYKESVLTIKRLHNNRKTKDSNKTSFYKKHGITVRDAMIHVAEDVLKPKKGKDIFGKKTAEELYKGLYVIPDAGGWLDEIFPVLEKSDNTLILRLHRDNKKFIGDSRKYFKKIDGYKIVDLHLTTDDIETDLYKLIDICKENELI